MSLYQHPTEKAFLYRQKGSKKIYMSYYDGSGKRRQKTTKTDDLEKAKLALQETLFLIKAEKSGIINLNSNRTETVGFIADQVIKELVNTKSGKKNSADIIRKIKIIKAEYSDLDIRKLNKKQLKRLFSEPMSKTQLSYLKSGFRAIFDYAEEEEIIESIPLFPKANIMKFEKSRFPINEKQYLALIDFLVSSMEKSKKSEVRENKFLLINFIILLKHTGIRIGELKNIKIENIENDGKNRYCYIPVSKTTTRKIILNQMCFNALDKTMSGKKKKDYLFSRLYDGKVPNFTQILQGLKKHNRSFFERNGLENFVLYNLRHTFITNSIVDGVELFYIAQHCGTSLDMIEKHYADYIVARKYENIYDKKTMVPQKSYEELINEYNNLPNKEV